MKKTKKAFKSSILYIAYLDGKDVIQAESWIKKHRSHRGHSGTMDEKLYKLYFPYGVDNDEHINDGNVNNSSGNFEFLTQMGDRIIQPAISMAEIYKNHFIYNPNCHNML